MFYNECNRIRPILPTAFDEALSYGEQLCELKEEIDKKNKPQENYNYNYTFTDNMFLLDSTLFPRIVRSYSYDRLQGDLLKLAQLYSNVRYKQIGLSVLGLPLYVVEIGSENAVNHLFVFDGFHGNEATTSVVLSEIEVVAKNRFFGGVDIHNEILNNGTCLHVFPMANPDAWQLGQVGFDYFPHITDVQKDFIKTNLEDYIRNYAKEEPLGSNWDLENKKDLEDYIRSLGGDPNISYQTYVFREKDLHCWEGNINGIDLHYNWYTPDMKSTVDIALANVNHGHPNGWVYGAQGANPYVDENAVYKKYIDECMALQPYSKANFINYHQKGPTNIWNYRLQGFQNNRAFDCGLELCSFMQVPYSATVGNQSTPIGFTAWCTRYLPSDYTLAYTMEVGWSNTGKRGDWWNNTNTPFVRSPVPDEQFGSIYHSNKAVMIWMLRYYTSIRDINNRHQYISEYNIKDNIEDTSRFSVPSMPLIRQVAQASGLRYSSVTQLGLGLNATLDEIIDKLNYTLYLTIMVNDKFALTNSFPSWFMSKVGELVVVPQANAMVVQFIPYKSNLVYQKIYDKTNGQTQSEWLNITPISYDYQDFGIGTTTTLGQICANAKEQHIIIVDVDPTFTINDKPTGFTDTYYRVKATGKRPNVLIELQGINNPTVYKANWSRGTSKFGTWYKESLTTI